MRNDPRPELRKWLAAPESWDELVFWCIGRFVHKPGDLADMIKWAQVHGKNLRSVTEDSNLATPKS
jgi:DNA invertase Pin-like site-specific DNA recombinase